MSIGRGNFILKCDHPDCDCEVDLETEVFSEAKQAADEWKDSNDWTLVRKGSTFTDICGNH